MNVRRTSRVTAVATFAAGFDRPRIGLRNGTRTNAAPSCWARTTASTAVTGADAVGTSGRLPITMGADGTARGVSRGEDRRVGRRRETRLTSGARRGVEQ